MANYLHYFEKETDAPGTNKGFYYQFLVTLRRWLTLQDNSQIFCETEDDIKIVDSAANALNFVQVKCYKSNFSFSSPEVIKSLCNFFILYQKYQKYEVDFIFESNNSIKESDKLFKEWKTYSLFAKPGLQEKCANKVKEILKEGFQTIYESSKKKINKQINKLENKRTKLKRQNALERNEHQITIAKQTLDDLDKNYEALIQDISNKTFHFVSRIRWQFGEVDQDKAINELEQDIIAQVHVQIGHENGHLIFGRLISEVIRRSAATNRSDRILDKNLLEIIILESEIEMRNNVLPEINGLVSKNFSLAFSKLDRNFAAIQELKEGFENEKISKLPFPLSYDSGDLNEIVENTKNQQTKLERKIKDIGLDDTLQYDVLETATELRASYLLYLDELTRKNHMHEHNIVKSLEKKVNYECAKAVTSLDPRPTFDSVRFWRDFQQTLENLLKRHSTLCELELDEYFVYAQMYQKAAECRLKWKKIAPNG